MVVKNITKQRSLLLSGQALYFVTKMHIFFTYSVVWNSYRKTFTVDGFWNPSPKLQANSLGPLLEDAWNVEKKRCEVER